MHRVPSVSIITITFNHERFIAKCITSVLAQTFQDWEQIIIDDGSTDRTREIIESFQDSRIHYYYKIHRGIWNLGENYNRALNLARGGLIAILEGDDFWPEDKLKKEVPLFSDTNIVMAWGRAVQVDVYGKATNIIPEYNFKKDIHTWRNKPLGAFLNKLFVASFKNPIPAVTVMVRKEALQKIGGFIQPSYLPLVDYPTWLNLTLTGEFRAVDDILGYYRRYFGQVTMGIGDRLDDEQIERNDAYYSLEFFSTIPPVIRNGLKITKKFLENVHKDSILSSYFTLGRISLIKKEWDLSRYYFRKCLAGKIFILKIKAVFGYVAAIFHINLEGFAVVLHKPRLR